MTGRSDVFGERSLILAPRGRDPAAVAGAILGEASIPPPRSAPTFWTSSPRSPPGGDLAIVTEEVIRHADTRGLAGWVASQAAWSDFPFVLLTRHGGGLELIPRPVISFTCSANVTFIERPFHPTTLISVVRSGLRSRQRQYECRRLNEELETRVEERTAELESANRRPVAGADRGARGGRGPSSPSAAGRGSRPVDLRHRA